MTETPEQKLQRLVDRSGDCWVWLGPIQSAGYARITYKGQSVYMHRLSYEQHKGPIPEGLQIDHLCRNRRCVNPEHLEAVTPRENTYRGQSPDILAHLANKCRRGHEMSGPNLHIRPNGRRHCRACQRLQRRVASPRIPHDGQHLLAPSALTPPAPWTPKRRAA